MISTFFFMKYVVVTLGCYITKMTSVCGARNLIVTFWIIQLDFDVAKHSCKRKLSLYFWFPNYFQVLLWCILSLTFQMEL